MPMAFGGYQYLLVITCDQMNFTIVTPLQSRDAQSVAKALICRVIYLFGPPRQFKCYEAAEFTSHIVQAILHVLNYKLKVISPYNHGSSKVERQIKTIIDIIVKHLWDKGQMWPLFATTAAYAMNTFASEALNGFSPFQLVFVCNTSDLTSLSFPKIDTIPVACREYYNLLLARAQMVGRLLLEWRTQQALEFENRNRQFTKKEIFEDNQMVYLLAPPSSDATGLLLDSTYQMNCIKKGSACTPQGIVNTFDDYEKALKNTLLNKSAIESPDNKFIDITLRDGSKGLMYSPCTLMDYASIYGKA